MHAQLGFANHLTLIGCYRILQEVGAEGKCPLKTCLPYVLGVHIVSNDVYAT